MNPKTVKFLYLFAALAVTLTACGGQAPASAPPAEPSAPTAPPAATEPPTAAPPAPEATPTLSVVNLGGPRMEVGATYRYVDGSILVAVPGGEFIMGYGNEENLEHRVVLGDFWIYRDEVTNAQYAFCVSLGQCSPPDPKTNENYGKFERRNDPVTGVKWEQAQAYCEFVNGRLPTEAEWEKTARGPNGNTYPWGEAVPNCELTNAGGCNPGTTEVTKYPKGASYYGAGDMVGNVFEWVADWFDPQYYRVSPLENPLGPPSGVYRSVRSSAFKTEFYLTPVARRFRELPTKARADLGFRCVVEDPALFAPWCQTSVFVPPVPAGGPSGSSIPSADCPVISATTIGVCDKNLNPPQPAAYLDFEPDPLPSGATTEVPAGCAPLSSTADPTDYYCTGAGVGEGPATIKAACTLPPPPAPPGCPPGYTQNGNMCEYSGGLPGNQCLPGITYAAATQCCQTVPGSASFPLCPADAPYNVGGVCMPWPISATVSQTVSVGLGSCGGTTTTGECPPGQNEYCFYDPRQNYVCVCR